MYYCRTTLNSFEMIHFVKDLRQSIQVIIWFQVVKDSLIGLILGQLNFWSIAPY
jgi:hypothetical protein